MNFRSKTQWFQTFTFLFCLGLTYVSYATVHNIAQTRSIENFQVLVDQAITSLGQRATEYRRTLDGVAGLILAKEDVSQADMADYAQAIDIKDSLFAIDAIGFAGVVPSTDPRQDETYRVDLIEPSTGHMELLGLKFVKSPELLKAAQMARYSGKMQALRLPAAVHDMGYPQALLLKPVMRTPNDGGGDGFVGFTFALLDLDAVFTNLTAAQDTLLTLDVSYQQTSRSGSQATVNATGAAADDPALFTEQKTVSKFGYDIVLEWRSTPVFEAAQPFRARWFVLSIGLLITALISSILVVLTRINHTVTAMVEEKSRDLETQGKEKRSILENAMLAIISVNKRGEIIHANQAGLDLLQPETRDVCLIGRSIYDMLPDIDLEDTQMWSKLQMPTVFGKPRVIEVQKNMWSTAECEDRVTLLMRDITVTERHAQALAEAEQRWNLALQGAKIGVYDLDLRNGTSVVSDTWRETLELDPQPGCSSPYNQQMQRMTPEDIKVLAAAEAACRAGTIDRAEACFRVEVGENNWRWIKTNAVVVERAPDGTALRMLGIQMDVTETFKLEQMKRDFVATVSHELRTPLTSIKGALSLLELQMKNSESGPMQRLVQIAASNSDRLSSLVNDILDIEKIRSGNMTHAAQSENLKDIMAMASDQVETYALQWQVNIDVNAPQQDQSIWTDKKRITQVLANLLSNACKFADAETTVRLNAEVLENCVRISVTNRGAGIPENFRSQIFQPFSQADNSDTRKRGGTGLGLNISRLLVEAMGGEIGFESEPGHETVFWFTCPLAEPAEAGLAA